GGLSACRSGRVRSHEPGRRTFSSSRREAWRRAAIGRRQRRTAVYEAFFPRRRKLRARLSARRGVAARRGRKPVGRRDLPARQRGTRAVPDALGFARGLRGWSRVCGTSAGLSRERGAVLRRRRSPLEEHRRPGATGVRLQPESTPRRPAWHPAFLARLSLLMTLLIGINEAPALLPSATRHPFAFARPPRAPTFQHRPAPDRTQTARSPRKALGEARDQSPGSVCWSALRHAAATPRVHASGGRRGPIPGRKDRWFRGCPWPD